MGESENRNLKLLRITLQIRRQCKSVRRQAPGPRFGLKCVMLRVLFWLAFILTRRRDGREDLSVKGSWVLKATVE